MYKERALSMFNKELFHNIRNGQDFEMAGANAIRKTREAIQVLTDADPDLTSDVAKEETWADSLLYIMFFKAQMTDFLYRLSKLPVEMLAHLLKSVRIEDELTDPEKPIKKVEKLIKSGAEQLAEETDAIIEEQKEG